ncbi:ATP-dependent DNA helicase [Pseudoroseomonas cervicalis]|uniref:ATP-dependent DNA helicase n=1 Tax=Teichococcus cervicalis TaxID=204525 RepID=UPI0022F190AD|nr:ATP-dependent DNA helicase [Pseudoroseomonas cervicalis]WBV43704.1 ATP-dependent DNA helicase [Pseudoroseomonas cervicalis]
MSSAQGPASALPPRLLLPDAPALVAPAPGRAALLTPDGELFTPRPAELPGLLREFGPPILVHAPAVAKRLNLPGLPGAWDLLELFAFCLPAQPAPPTPRGLALALDMTPPEDAESAAALLPEIATELLRRLARARSAPLNKDAGALAARMAQAADWAWTPSVLAALGLPSARPSQDALKVWRALPEWEEEAPPPPPASHAVTPTEARGRLAEILGDGAEQRPSQADFASAASLAFTPRETPGEPRLVLAEAGTGTGKTLGYVAPASLWAERNGAPVWIATYTRNLQRQLDQELARLYPDPEDRRKRVVIRKGRENYLCLLNYDEAVTGAMPARLVALGLVARWALATRDGDLLGGDFPGWLMELFPSGAISLLADRRGECIHSACPHWKRCYVEHSIRRAAGAHLVVANHALVMVQAALGGGEDGPALRYVFDEGHHLFDAADGAFSAELSGAEMAELRRWLLGNEGGRGRARGLRRRLEEMLAEHPALVPPLELIEHAARALPSPGWWDRWAALPEEDAERAEDRDELPEDPRGPALPAAPGIPRPRPFRDSVPAEDFLRAVRAQVLARTAEGDPLYDAECDLHPLLEDMTPAAVALEVALERLRDPLKHLASLLTTLLEDPDQELETGTRIRLETASRSIERRALMPLSAWLSMLRRLHEEPAEPGQRPTYVDWLALTRREGRDIDAGLHRHWLDPTMPFATQVAAPAHGVLIASATLRDAGRKDPESAWREAEARTGVQHLPAPAVRAALPSPFDYAANTRAFIVDDMNRDSPGQVAAAMQQLFLAAGGGGLGLFTAIRRLRDVHARIAPALAEAGLPLYAQHVDAMDSATLVDIFRAEEDSCLLGTDALRDGVDVPGRALRLLVFDRVPWPRPSILHRERRIHLSGGRPGLYDDAIARHRLRQAFGRLIRRADDRGVFVLLDPRTPSRLLAGLPEGVAPQRLGLADAVRETTAFLAGR